MTDASTPARPRIIVAGDIVIDHHLYEGERRSATSDGVRGVAEVRAEGGAALVHRLLQTAHERKERSSILVGTKPPSRERHGSQHAFAVWKPFARTPGKKEDGSVWRCGLVMGYGEDSQGSDVVTNRRGGRAPYVPEPLRLPNDAAPHVLVLDDAGIRFRHNEHRACWLLPENEDSAPDWIVLKIAAPVAQGDLWNELIARFADRLVCVVSANDLRREQIKLGYGLSWERTIEELRDGLERAPVASELRKCRHLVVTFSVDGALWIDRSDGEPRATLVCDAGSAEGEFDRRHPGKAFGYLSCMTASVALALSRSSSATARDDDAGKNMGRAVSNGLAAMQNLLVEGHGPVSDDPPDGFPFERVAAVINGASTPQPKLKDEVRFLPAIIPVPWRPPPAASASPTHPWMIVEMSQRPLGSPNPPSLIGMARELVLRGPRVLARLPHAAFGDLLTADRSEIEALRSIQSAMLRYHEEERPKRPLSIGVFGPPGAGKSFGVKELAKAIYGEKSWMEFNLSQFSDVSDLIGAFHQVRDVVLGGVTPVVFWDEFDSRNYRWLQLLLAPMQDSRFQEGNVTHAIGKCVFVFAGGTFYSFAEFARPSFSAEQKAHFRLAKGPDFASRLDEYYDVLGPNRRTVPSVKNQPGDDARDDDPTDLCHPLRRAILVRSFLTRDRQAPIAIDSDLLDALLQVPTYQHGARSLEKLVRSLRPDSDGAIRRSALPPPQGLQLHVDAQAFLEILDSNAAFQQEQGIEVLANAVHSTWRALSVAKGWKMDEAFDRDFNALSPADKEDNRAAARRMPEVLALAGLRVAKLAEGAEPFDPDVITQHLRHHIERLAEAEHDGWFYHRSRSGWKLSDKKVPAKRLHPCLVPYAALSENDREKDRDSVRHYPEFAALAGYDISFIEG